MPPPYSLSYVITTRNKRALLNDVMSRLLPQAQSNEGIVFIDAEPFDTRLTVRAQGGDREGFTKEPRSPMSFTVTGAFPFRKASCGGCRCSGIFNGCSGKVRLRSLNGALFPLRRNWNDSFNSTSLIPRGG